VKPPIAPERPHLHDEHGVVREDPWYWMRDRGDHAVRDHLEAENAYTEACTAHLAPLRETLLAEFRARMQEDDVSVPARDGPWEYYRRVERGRPYPIHCRRPSAGGHEQVMLDVNLLAEGRDFASVDGLDWSPDHRTLAYATEFAGDERYTVRFRRLDLPAEEEGAPSDTLELDDAIANTSGNVAWIDNETLWVVTLDESLRPYQVWRHRVGHPEEDHLVYQETDERFRVGVGRSRSGRFLVLYLSSFETTEIRLLEVPVGGAVGGIEEREARPLLPRVRGARIQVAHAGDVLHVITNVGPDGVPGSASNGRLLELPLGEDGSWGEPVERIAHQPSVQLVGIQGFETFSALTVRDHGQLRIRIVPLVSSGEEIRDLQLLEVPSAVAVGENHEWSTRTLRVGYGSMTTPQTTLAFDLDRPDEPPVRLKEVPVPGYDRSRYRTARLEAVAEDGTRIPLSVVHHVDVDPLAGPHPTVLSGYGAYGIPLDPSFQSARVSLLDRGVVFVTAHVRGGGDLGRPWYEAGKLAYKARSFTDFVAAARHLVEAGITAPDRLIATGGSAGGLLVGASMNLAPELFRAVAAHVPFVDVLTTMLDASLPLTAGEWDEWGDPRERQWFDLIRSYSPIDNVSPVKYPDLLATGAWSDQRVQYWEPAKWVAKLRKVATGGRFLLRTELAAGHQGPSGRYAPLALQAFTHAWMLDELGLGATTA
jgi:oligopeptidase B